MSENINNNIRNDINPENIETIDFDALESISASTSKAEVDIPSIEEMEENSAEVGEIDKDDSIDSDDFIDSVSPRSNLVDLNLIGELQEGEVKYLQIGKACIEVKSRILYSELFDSVQTAIALTLDNKPYISEPLKEMIGDIQILRSYTNLDFRFFDTLEFDPNELYNIYGLLMQEDVVNKVKNLIDQKQLDFWLRSYDDTLKSIVAYRNSAMGIITSLQQKEEEAGTGLEQALDSLKDAENQEAIQNMLKLMGLDDQAADTVIQLAGEIRN